MDDLISREAAIDAVGYYSLHSGDKILFADKPLKELPAAQPQRMQGRWVEHKWAEEVAGMLISNYACSCCSSWERINSDFCPNCGADMREAKG